ncbi:MAG TPA: cytochrome c [Methylomirabilota bacterium]|jgi:mono/diheme cytochrome c family protein
MKRAGLMLTFVALVASGCGEPTGLSAQAERGRQVYFTQCTTCHATDPAQAGPLGPPVKGAPRELLEAKVLRGAYPPGYQPKRPTAVMPPQPGLAPDIPGLAEYLK